MLKLKLALGFLCLFLFARGVQGSYTALTNWNQTIITCKDFYEKGSSASWLRITDCDINLLNTFMVWKEGRGSSNKTTVYYVPLYPAGTKELMAAKVFLQVNSADTNNLLSQLAQVGNNEAALANFVRQNRSSILKTGEVNGVVKFGMESDSQTQDLLLKKAGATPDFIILDELASPDIVEGFGMLFLSLLGIGGLAFWHLRYPEAAAAPATN